mmetsp:Transcript_124632/g.360558  ORF Transcript_124632/g.360558 Transcript_124632/m.360558 type:complete len:210 (+) Transcript_124632:119-748(+)
MVVASSELLAPVFKPLIQELETKVRQVEENVSAGVPASRKDLELYIWKTGRVVRLLVKPEASPAREIFWSECKGILKQCLAIEHFNAGVFRPECVQKDILETHLLKMLEKLLDYTRRRLSGQIAPPDEVQTVESAAKRARLAKEEKEAEEKKKLEQDWAKQDQAWASWRGGQELQTRWDDVDSDPGEECPDKAKTGSCSYGRQCGFCYR